MILSMRLGLVALFAAGLCLADSLSDALASKRFQDALQLSDSLLKERPRDPRLWSARGMALDGLNRPKESLASFEKALQYSPQFPPALKGAAEVSYRTHDARAAAMLDRLLRLEPDNAVAHAMAGVLAYEARDCPSAVGHFEHARTQIESNEQANLFYGACLLVVQRPLDAIPVFERISALHPESTGFRFNLARAQLLARNPEAAIRTLQAAPVAPGAEALSLLASAEASAGRLESAISHLRKAAEIAPRDEQNYVDLAALCLQQNAMEDAAAAVETGLRNVPKSARLYSIRGIIRAQAGRSDDAAADFDRANRLDPDEQYGAAGLGVLYSETDRGDSAIKVLRERLRKNPDDATLNYLLAQVLMHESPEPGTPQFAEARGALLKSIRSKPDFARAHTLLGKMHIRSEENAQAVEEFRLAVKYDPNDRTALSQLAIALRRLGRNDEAIPVLQRLRELVNEDYSTRLNKSPIQIAAPPDR